MTKQIFENEYVVFPRGSGVKIVSSNIEQCVFVGCEDESSFGAIHIKPALYLDDDFLSKIKEFLSCFEMDKVTNVTIIGGIDGEGEDELDAQKILFNALTSFGVSEKVIRCLNKYDEENLINVVYDESGRIEYEKVPMATRVEQDKLFYAAHGLNPKTPTFNRRFLAAKSGSNNLVSARNVEQGDRALVTEDLDSPAVFAAPDGELVSGEVVLRDATDETSFGRLLSDSPSGHGKR